MWNRHDLVAAIIRHLPERLRGVPAADVRDLVAQLADQALTAPLTRDVVTLTPPDFLDVPEELLRSDGRSRFEM